MRLERVDELLRRHLSFLEVLHALNRSGQSAVHLLDVVAHDELVRKHVAQQAARREGLDGRVLGLHRRFVVHGLAVRVRPAHEGVGAVRRGRRSASVTGGSEAHALTACERS